MKKLIPLLALVVMPVFAEPMNLSCLGKVTSDGKNYDPFKKAVYIDTAANVVSMDGWEGELKTGDALYFSDVRPSEELAADGLKPQYIYINRYELTFSWFTDAAIGNSLMARGTCTVRESKI